MKWLTAVLAFGLVWIGAPSEADAAPIGMCSELGESIAAPPPLYAASDAEMRACDPAPEDTLQTHDDGQRPTRVAQPETNGEQYVVFEETFHLRKSRTVAHSTAPLSYPMTEEHRAANERPPQG